MFPFDDVIMASLSHMPQRLPKNAANIVVKAALENFRIVWNGQVLILAPTDFEL